MHQIHNGRRLLLGSIVLLTGMSTAVSYGKQPITPTVPPVAGVVQKDRSGALLVPLGGLVTFDPELQKGDVLTDIIVAREDILSVRLDPANPGKLLMTGRAAGLTQLTLIVQGKPRFVYDVLVQPDLNLLRGLIKRTVPSAAVEVQPGVGNVIIISGYAASPKDADIIERLVASTVGNVNNVVNAVQVGGGQQVQIDVVVASVDRNMLRQRGFDFAVRGANFRFDSIVSGLLSGGLPAAQVPTGGTLLFQGGVPAQFLGALQALRNEGVAKFIAEPRVVTQTGRPAFFRAGGQQAIISGTSGITGPGVQLVPFGTELEVLPIVYGNGMIWLELNPRISAVSQALGISIGATVSPGFTEQQVRAAVMLESGQTFAIGGLIQNSIQATASKVPVLGDVPFLGTAFSRVSHEIRESELVILVTPRIVAPMNCDQVPGRLPGRETRNPDDYELFLENILEAPRGQRKVWNGRCYNAAWKSSPTAAQFPCAGNVHTGGNMGGGCANGNCSSGGNLGIIGPNGIGLANPGAVTVGAVNPVAPTDRLPSVPMVLPPVPQPAAPVNLPAVPGAPIDGPTTSIPAAPTAPMTPSSQRSGAEPAPISLPPVVVIPQAPQK
ncbi:MAG: pilus assembly protein N-terminal domain-containing protein [Planctomycetes bacterium]|nr:pilus assembly protein N-terminal domain-containing protein [Planctomycetota bacterium]